VKEDWDDTPVEKSSKLLEKIIPLKEVKKLYPRSDFEGIKQTLFHLGCILLSGYLIHLCFSKESSFIFLALAFVLHGYFLSFLFMPLHECVHRTAFKTIAFNKILASICGFLTLRPPFNYTLYHFAHHKFTGNTALDPELQNSFIDLRLDCVRNYLFYITGIPFWIDTCNTTFIQHALLAKISKNEHYVRNPNARQKIIAEARFFSLLYACILVISLLFHIKFFLYYWVIPSFIGQVFLRFYLLHEHTGCQSNENMLNNTRTTATNFMTRKLAWNMPYHSEHHAFPAVPFFMLPELNKLLDKNDNNNKKKKNKNDDNGCVPTGRNGFVYLNYALVKQLLTK